MSKIDQSFSLAEANYRTVLENDYRVAMLPWGATEAHNYHLPYGTDNFQVDFVADRSSALAAERGIPVLRLPTVPYGINTGQLDIPFCMNLLPSTQLAILRDIADVLGRHGVSRLLLLNGHGGNDFKNHIRELSFYHPTLFVCWVNWYRIVDWKMYFSEPGDHAGEMETSAMQYLRPDLVRPLDQAGPGIARALGLSGFREGWAVTQREWSRVTDDTGVGNPYQASAKKGRVFLEDCSNGLAHFLTELHEVPDVDLYH